MKYAVEARIFNTGKIVAKVREAEEWEKDVYKDTRSCDIYVDIFDSKDDAEAFLRDYRKA